jgi:chorismate mutase / prephenate dehydratase
LDLAELRSKIDGIDADLLELLNKRMQLVNQIGKIKQISGGAIYRPEREKAILDRLSGINSGLLNRQAIEAIFMEIFAVSRNLELPEKVCYLGPEGSFTHQAAEIRFGAMTDYIPLQNIKSVFESVSTGRAKFGVVPIENNQEGMVMECVHGLAAEDICIIAEVPLSIHFAFASLNENVKDIKRIYSKDIAFRQCKKFLDEYFADNAELIAVESTSKAAKMAAEEAGSAALCSSVAAKIHNLPMLFDNVEDSDSNATRFLIISKDMSNQKSGNDKTTIFARTGDEPGSLAQLLKDFQEYQINLCKIESYPAKTGQNFKYWFLIEFDGHQQEENVSLLLNKHKESIKWLGSYAKLC